MIFGAGHDAAPVGAAGLDARLRRDGRRRARRVPDARPLSGRDADLRAFQAVRRTREARRRQPSCSMMNHHVERDQESLRFSLDSDAAYIGVLGPRARYDKLLAGLAAQGCTPDGSTAARVRSPVGLSLGAETPARSGGVDPGRDPGDSTRVRRRVPQRLGRAAFTGPTRGGSWPARSLRACRYPPADRPETAGWWSARDAAAGRSRAPCWSWASSGKNSRSKRCGGAMTSPYRTLTMGCCVLPVGVEHLSGTRRVVTNG